MMVACELDELVFSPTGRDVCDTAEQQDHGAARRAWIELRSREARTVMAHSNSVLASVSRPLPASSVRLGRGAQDPSTDDK